MRASAGVIERILGSVLAVSVFAFGWPYAAGYCGDLPREDFDRVLIKLENAERRAAGMGNGGDEVAGAIAAVIDAGKAAHRAGDWPQAEKLLKRALHASRQVAEGQPSLASSAANNLGAVLFAQGRHAEAREAFEIALQGRIRQFGPGDPRLFSVLSNLAALETESGNHQRALTYYQRALSVHRNIGRKAGAKRAKVLNNIGMLHSELGRYADAIPFYLDAVEAHSKSQPEATGDLVNMISNLAHAREAGGQYAMAKRDYHRAEELLSHVKPPRPDLELHLMNNMAMLDFRLGRLDQALNRFRRAFLLLEENPQFKPKYSVTLLHNSGVLFLNRGEATSARVRLEAAVEQLRNAEDLDEQKLANSLNNLGLVLLELGEYSPSEQVILEALAIRERTLPSHHVYIAISLRNLARHHMETGRVKDAIVPLQRSLAIRKRAYPGGHPEIADALDLLSDAYVLLDRLDLSVVLGKAAVNELQRFRGDLARLAPAFRASFIRNKSGVYRKLAGRLVELGRIPEAEQVLHMLREEEYFDYVDRELSSDLRTTRMRLSSAENQALDQWIEGGASHVGSPVEDAMSPTGRGVDGSSDIATVAYLVYPDHLRIMARHGLDSFQTKIVVDEAQLNRHIVMMRQFVIRRSSELDDESARLHSLLIDPLIPELDRWKVTRVQLWLDGALRYLPFAMLHDGERFLVERYALERVSFGLGRGEETGDPGPLRIAAFGVSEASPALELPALPYVREELDRVVRSSGTDKTGVIPGMQLMDAKFTRERLFEVMRNDVGLLHIASHFVLRPGNDLDSYLLLGGDAKLSVRDFRDGAPLMRSNVLVTLSACDTGVEKLRDGNEVEGLATSMMQRGANRVLASLWPVADRSTAELMSAFYRSATGDGGFDPPLALRNAQLALLNHGGDGKPNYSHPYFWAPFVMSIALPQSTQTRM